jgi:hypothetical protein
VMSQEKNSTGTTDFAVEYDLVEVEVTTDSGRAAKVARFEITGDSDRTSADVLRENASPTRSKSKGEIVLWLGQFLADGPKHSKIGTLRGFRHRGWSKDQFKKNRRAAGVVSKKCGDHWFWMTAEQKLQIEMGAPAPEVTPEELEEIRLAEEEGLDL